MFPFGVVSFAGQFGGALVAGVVALVADLVALVAGVWCLAPAGLVARSLLARSC